MTENVQIYRHVCKAHHFHVACGPAIEAPLMTMLALHRKEKQNEE